MKNYELVEEVIGYIEKNLDNMLDLDEISKASGYSKYHLSRMFSACADCPIHEYVMRRKLTEAAGKLAETDERIIDIALGAGYDNQQSFTIGFSKVYGNTPAEYRDNKIFTPLQLILHVAPIKHLKGDYIMDIRIEKNKQFKLVGVTANTSMGFQAIGMCWGQLHQRKGEIENRTDLNFLVGVNDYSAYDVTEAGQQAFDYYAAAEVASFAKAPEMMVTKELPTSDYVVFTYRGKAQDSMEPVVNYIYREWFPESSCVLNENARFDLVRYGEETDENGESSIEYWVPVM